jgi:sigma-B regulation protein RsbU (phosphoserine phosphatase)
MHQELEDARQIQQSLLPDKPPQIEGFGIAGTSLPAREVSGDFYDYLSLGKDTGIVLADVTGKSVQAAMVAAMANGMLDSEIRGQRELWNSPGGILKQLNIGLQPRLTHTMFTAMSLGILQVEANSLLFSNAGMPYPIVKRRGREVRELTVNGLPLGITNAAEYDDLSIDLEDGDFVVFYSDGVIEAENEAGDMYQTERLLKLIQQADPGISAQEMVDLIVSDVTEFVGDVEPSDDITVMVLHYSGVGKS